MSSVRNQNTVQSVAANLINNNNSGNRNAQLAARQISESAHHPGSAFLKQRVCESHWSVVWNLST
jgi:hypothetical protein